MLRITFPSDWPDPLTSETLWLGSWPPTWRWLSASQEPQCIGLDSVSWPAEKFSYAETIIQFTLGNVTLRCKTYVEKEKIIFCKTKKPQKTENLKLFFLQLYFVLTVVLFLCSEKCYLHHVTLKHFKYFCIQIRLF